ncbi:MAG: hydrogenase maturation peptidase HycI, partial [Methanobrevibacter sp.]|jgi:hydrogenase 3 maturation protease|nr:hydrogenase maturation peptidase HycI [Candidatus Methanoflexus mossambicus]
MEKPPGEIALINENRIAKYTSSSHSMSISFFIKYLKQFIDFKCLVLAITPKSMNFSNTLSSEVEKSKDDIVNILISLISDF